MCWSAVFLTRQGREVCKTVGSAYIGSNPTPATTCGNGPLAAETRPAGRFLLVTPCIATCHPGSMRCGVHGRIADGVQAVRTVGAHRRLFHGRPRTGRAGGVLPDDFEDLDELVDIRDWIEHWNQNPRPLAWTKKPKRSSTP